MVQQGMIDSGIRLPLTPLSEAYRETLAKALEAYFS
jgi:dihydrodipicolinate synthase/N-acetylneuraminate lyase